MNDKLIIEKLKELIAYYIRMTRKISTPYVTEIESELTALESSPDDKHETDGNSYSDIERKNDLVNDEIKKHETANFYQTRDLTDEEWLKLPKEEILQLYKNCYKMLMQYINQSPSGTVEEIKISDICNRVITGSYSISHEGMKEDASGWEHYAKRLEKMVSVGEFAAQSKQKQVTDEEIDKWAKGYDLWSVNSSPDRITRDALRAGAKAMRDGKIK